jgi:EAL domain-containing protein (putative c-di-GMP-specific phosphodiesterase class I)
VSTADRACREAKKKRGSHLVVFERDSCVFQEHEAEIRLAGLLSGSDEIEGLYLEMQPIMSLKEPHHSLNFEVLLRMRDPEGQEVPTTRLITAAENSGRMGVIDRWVLRQTLAWMRESHGRLKHTRFICMNLSGASLNDERFVQDVVRMLAQYADVAPRLCLEITESVALHDLENTRRFIAQVHGFGAKVALDDFGAGYTSFSYLKELRGDLLKIDGGFIVNMNEHPANVAIVEAIVGLARNLGMKTIAEWAEDSATVQTLAEIGVDYVQGFAIARSQSPESLLRMRSSADFVKDADLLHYLLLQAWPAPSLFSDPKPGQSTH